MKGKTILLLVLSFCFIASSCFTQQYKPPKVDQIAWQRHSDDIYLAIEIINENRDVGLYRSPISVILYNENKKIIGTNTTLSGDYDEIYLLTSNEKIVYAKSISNVKEEPADIKITFPELKWIDLSNINVPKATISEENLVEDDYGDKTFFCMLTNESEYKLDFYYVVISFYSKDGKLFGADYSFVDEVHPNSTKPVKISTFFDVPNDIKYVAKAYPTEIPDLEK